MVASANSDPYTPFPQGIILDEGPQSSEEGSGLHSPIFGAPFPPPHGDSSLRYHHDQLDVQHAAGILASQFDYHAVPALNVQQHPLLDTTPSSAHLHRVNYPPDFPLPPRNQLGLDYPAHLPSDSRLSPPPYIGHGDYVFHSTSERRMPGGQSHEQSSYRYLGNPGLPMDGDHKSSATERNSYLTIAPSSPREQRKEISTVVIACHQCRARKIRCDSTRPVCNNCLRRSNECHYDTVPKRRGPDKRPGTRQRSCKKRPSDGPASLPPSKRKRPERSEEPVIARIKPAMDNTNRPSSRHSHIDDPRQNRVPHGSPPSDLATSQINNLQRGTPTTTPPPYLHAPNSFVRSLNGQFDIKPKCEQDDKEGNHDGTPPPAVLEYNQKVWDNLLRTYSSNPEQSLKDIVADLSFLFSNTSYWLSFVNPLFLQSLYTDDRLRIQPSFVLASLALATLMKSSEAELGETGRNRALWFRDAAQRHLESSWGSRWIDSTLAEAALVLALFESSVHPQYSHERMTASLVLLDNIIRAQSLTFNDAHEPGVSIFGHNVPIVNDLSIGPEAASKEVTNPARQYERKCTCILPDTKLPADHLSRYWSCPLPWDSAWSPAEVRKEECRRLCWCALNIVSSYTSQCAVLNKTPPDLFLTNPANFTLLFPGEALERTSSNDRPPELLSQKESIWALYCRSMLLWNFCDRLRNKNSGEEQAESALEAWAETQTIEDALDMHDCNMNTSLLYMSREYMYNTRMAVTQSLRSLQGLDNGPSSPDFKPSSSRKQAEEWLYYQDQVIRRVNASIHHLNDPQGQPILTRRPFQVTWFSNQLAICLSLWEHDHSLQNALELGKSVLVLVEILGALWPCPPYRVRCDELREKLVDACTTVGLRPPHPPDGSLSPLLRAR